MTETARPKFVVPIHGEYRMLFRQKEFIKNHVEGYTDENIILIENGDVLELDENRARIVAHNELEKTFIDEEGSDEIEYDIVRERKKLAYGGIVSLVITIDKETKKLKNEPQVSVQGVAGIDSLNGDLQNLREAIADVVNGMKREEFVDKNFAKENLRIQLKRLLQKETGAKPVIFPTIVEV
jgi:ribonuclease J